MKTKRFTSKFRGFTTKRVREKRNSDFSFPNECREQTLSSGFTLIEALIAVTIITFSVAGPLFTANRAIVAAQNTRLQLTASYLAQEGVEYVRAMRDDEYLAAYQRGGANVSNVAWNDFIYGSSSASITQCSTSACTLDPAQPMGTGDNFSLQRCSGASCAPLYLRSDGVYTQQQTDNTRTPYTRTIQVFTVPVAAANPTEVRVVSRVSWDFHDTSYSLTITDHLTPWQ